LPNFRLGSMFAYDRALAIERWMFGRGGGVGMVEAQEVRLLGIWVLPVLLSVIAGAADVIGFLALGGLFTAHITGNMVVLAAHFVNGRFGHVGPIVAVPVFMAVICLVTLLAGAVEKTGAAPLKPLLVLQAVLLAGFLVVGIWIGPDINPDRPFAVLAGMLGVAAMATQNATVKLALKHGPTTAVMTTNITQFMLDLTAVIFGHVRPDARNQARQRAAVTFPCILGFILGCAFGAALQGLYGLWSLTLPVVLAVIAPFLARPRKSA
jgi:uncharacterized membrane protein YoaK (UPF0700 family)